MGTSKQSRRRTKRNDNPDRRLPAAGFAAEGPFIYLPAQRLPNAGIFAGTAKSQRPAQFQKRRSISLVVARVRRRHLVRVAATGSVGGIAGRELARWKISVGGSNPLLELVDLEATV